MAKKIELTIEDDMFEAIEAFKSEAFFRTRSAAVEQLIRDGLLVQQRKKALSRGVDAA